MTEIFNGLAATPHRRAFLRAVNQRGRIYMHRTDHIAWDNAEGTKVTARLTEAFQAGWVEPVPEADLWPTAKSFLVFYRLTDYGRAALGNSSREKSSG